MGDAVSFRRAVDKAREKYRPSWLYHLAVPLAPLIGLGTSLPSDRESSRCCVTRRPARPLCSTRLRIASCARLSNWDGTAYLTHPKSIPLKAFDITHEVRDSGFHLRFRSTFGNTCGSEISAPQWHTRREALMPWILFAAVHHIIDLLKRKSALVLFGQMG
jgi:hypothetical protein